MAPSPDDAAEIWTSEVLIPIAGRHFLARLEAMERWLSEWNIPYQVVHPALDDSALVLRFPRERFARAFVAMQLSMPLRDLDPAERGRRSPISSWATARSMVRGCV